VSDGLEAVRKAEELQPDLVVLDIGLPSLNGIEAARRIRRLSPSSKILFLSQESASDVVHEALSLGALGYVVKAHAGKELLAAVDAVLQGKQFVSDGLSVNRFLDVEEQSHDRVRQNEARSLLRLKKEEATRSHAVQFYSDDESMLAGFTRFIETALTAGNAVIVIATPSHRENLLLRLQAHGIDSAASIEQGRYIPLDVAETLSKYMPTDLPDPVRFSKATSELIVTAAKAVEAMHGRVVACGECAPTLWAQGKAEAAIQLEHLWDEMSEAYHVDVLCGYVLSSFQREQESHVYERICAEHSTVNSR
jgi:ActR/RegA family two-component response regulator